MAEEKSDVREGAWRQLFPWTELFRCFKVAIDPNKLLLAAAGILVMSLGWWVLAGVFSVGWKEPQIGAPVYTSITDSKLQWETFKRDRESYNLMHETAGAGSPGEPYAIEDLAEGDDEYRNLERLKKEDQGLSEDELVNKLGIDRPRARLMVLRYRNPKPYATLAKLPWFEERGPNPYLMVTGQVRGAWDAGHFWEWFFGNQVPVMIEPLVKIVQPIVYFFSPRATAYARFYFLLVTLWTVLTWSIFGGAITRIAAVEVARGEKIGLGEALRFTTKRWLSYVAAPIFPLLFVVFLLVLTAIYGLFFMIPFLGDLFVAGLFWWIPLLLGLAMACTLVGLAVGWPLMAPTVSAEGTDSWEAVSRSFTYVFQRPWHYIWYAMVGLFYGAVAVFFIGFMGSFTVYLAKWGVNSVQPSSRDASFLFIYSPTSFGWRTLLLRGAMVDGKHVVQGSEINEKLYEKYVSDDNRTGALAFYNRIGAFMVAFWLYILFLMIIGFGYSFFWSMSTLIYLLMRRHVDTAEMDEVYLEEEEDLVPGGFPAPPPPPAGAITPKPPGPTLTMVEAPALRPSPAPAPVTNPPPTPASSPAATAPAPAPAPLPAAEGKTGTATQPKPSEPDEDLKKLDADEP